MAPPVRQKPSVAGLKDDRQKGVSLSPLARSAINTTFSSTEEDPGIRDSLAGLTIQNEKPDSKPIETPEIGTAIRPSLLFEDEQTNVSISSTKPASLDGKSTASGTTFAMDEKESLRPDDSASVKAAEEEDSYSGPGSGAASSHVGSEAGGRAFRDQFYEISERIGCVPDRTTIASHREIPGIEEETAQAAIPPLQVPVQEAVTTGAPSVLPAAGSIFPMNYTDPDEKLLEALESPKDRLFVLRLEHDVINFISDSTVQTLDLRTPNSFCRLLAHKLADYYALTHHADGAQNLVKLYRTPYCRIRPPLISYPQANPGTEIPASNQPAVKIMRRAGIIKDGHRADSGPNTTASSIAPSKANSENGDDGGRATGLVSPTESDLSKDRMTMTREEREAKYKEARDRIFNENTDTAIINDAGQGISRTSSANGRRKSRKHRNNDDGFEARSHFTAYYPAMQYSGPTFSQAPSSAYFDPCMPQQYPTLGEPGATGPAMYSSNYESNYPSMSNTLGYPGPMQPYAMGDGSTINGFSNMQPFPGYALPMPQQYYQPHQTPQGSPALGQHSPVLSSPTLSSSAQLSRSQSQAADQQWGQMTYQYPYQQPRNQQPFSPPRTHLQDSMPTAQTVPYQYGQLPYQPHLPGSRNAHPLPGSYNRQQAFNPQTRSFVPGSSSQPFSNGTGVPDPPSNHRFPGATSPILGPPYTVPPQGAAPLPGGLQFGTFSPSIEQKSHPPRKFQTGSIENQPPAKSSLAKWATPANLPPKPPPPDPPSMPEGRLSLPQSVPTHNNVSLMSNGPSMPTFQNGVYTLPGHSHQ
ncbi:MAG: hypothetical protein Q9182_002686 [Xanthomendoza sp. 2 TL-2023]